MTLLEFSNEFDILYNNIMSNLAPGLDEYEKSVFLTLALEEIVKSYYKGNYTGIGPFEDNEEVRLVLSNLIVKTEGLTPKIDQTNTDWKFGLWYYDKPVDLCYIIHEYILDVDRKFIPVIPVTYDELNRIKNNPFRMPSNTRILRILSGDNTITLISPEISLDESQYFISYIKHPKPIILVNLESIGENLTINNLSGSSESELHPSIHRLILTQAVQLAAAAYKS